MAKGRKTTNGSSRKTRKTKSKSNKRPTSSKRRENSRRRETPGIAETVGSLVNPVVGTVGGWIDDATRKDSSKKNNKNKNNSNRGSSSRTRTSEPYSRSSSTPSTRTNTTSTTNTENREELTYRERLIDSVFETDDLIKLDDGRIVKKDSPEAQQYLEQQKISSSASSSGSSPSSQDPGRRPEVAEETLTNPLTTVDGEEQPSNPEELFAIDPFTGEFSNIDSEDIDQFGMDEVTGVDENTQQQEWNYERQTDGVIRLPNGQVITNRVDSSPVMGLIDGIDLGDYNEMDFWDEVWNEWTNGSVEQTNDKVIADAVAKLQEAGLDEDQIRLQLEHELQFRQIEIQAESALEEMSVQFNEASRQLLGARRNIAQNLLAVDRTLLQDADFLKKVQDETGIDLSSEEFAFEDFDPLSTQTGRELFINSQNQRTQQGQLALSLSARGVGGSTEDQIKSAQKQVQALNNDFLKKQYEETFGQNLAEVINQQDMLNDELDRNINLIQEQVGMNISSLDMSFIGNMNNLTKARGNAEITKLGIPTMEQINTAGFMNFASNTINTVSSIYKRLSSGESNATVYQTGGSSLI